MITKLTCIKIPSTRSMCSKIHLFIAWDFFKKWVLSKISVTRCKSLLSINLKNSIINFNSPSYCFLKLKKNIKEILRQLVFFSRQRRVGI
jgi:hypothetical protein